MPKLNINWNIDIKDLIQLVLVVIGGIATYVLVDGISTRNDTIRTKELLLGKLVDFYPFLQTNYTNELSAKGDTLFLRTYVKNHSKYPVHYGYPTVWLLDEKDTIRLHWRDNLQQFGGIIAPGASY